ncbi:MAG: efflux RND transporter periplasmic adaptor subunit [Alphaproteobacteria bacterium]
MGKIYLKLAILLPLAGFVACGDSSEIQAEDPPPRPIKTFIVTETADSIERSFPSVLQPKESSELSFEVSGQLGPVDLQVGQSVRKGDVLLAIDRKSLELELDRAKTGVTQAEAQLRNARGSFDRQDKLLTDGFTTRAAHDDAETALQTREAELDSARAQQSLAEESLSKAEIVAPFDGTISRINVQAFDIVAPGPSVISIYDSTRFEIEFAVPPTIVNALATGQPAIVRVAQRRDIELTATLTEIGSRAEGSNGFPAVATLTSLAAGLKSGMAAEVVLSIPVADGGPGILIPISAMALNNRSPANEPATDQSGEQRRQGQVYRYDPETETVKIHPVTISGVRGNMLIVTGGLEMGDRIASAGVSYLFDGQAVTLPQAE